MYYTFCGCCTVIAEIRVSKTSIYLYATNCYVQFVHSCIRKLIESGKTYLHCLKFTKMLIIKLKLVVKDDVNKTQTRAFFFCEKYWKLSKKKKKNTNRIDLFCSKEKTTDNRMCTLSSFGRISSNDSDASIQPFLPPAGKKQRPGDLVT